MAGRSLFLCQQRRKHYKLRVLWQFVRGHSLGKLNNTQKVLAVMIVFIVIITAVAIVTSFH